MRKGRKVIGKGGDYVTLHGDGKHLCGTRQSYCMLIKTKSNNEL